MRSCVVLSRGEVWATLKVEGSWEAILVKEVEKNGTVVLGAVKGMWKSRGSGASTLLRRLEVL